MPFSFARADLCRNRTRPATCPTTPRRRAHRAVLRPLPDRPDPDEAGLAHGARGAVPGRRLPRAQRDGTGGTGWAAEREGDGDVNSVACLENTETSAIGRALANLGFTASRERASAEEMAKASRARARLVVERATGVAAAAAEPPRTANDLPGRTAPPLDERSALVADLLRLVAAAERAGVRPRRAAAWRAALAHPSSSGELLRYERRLRGWLLRRLP